MNIYFSELFLQYLRSLSCFDIDDNSEVRTQNRKRRLLRRLIFFLNFHESHLHPRGLVTMYCDPEIYLYEAYNQIYNLFYY